MRTPLSTERSRSHSPTSRDGRLDHLARAGLVAYAVVYLMIAWLAIQLAFGDRQGNPSSTGALRELAQQPLGEVLGFLAVAVHAEVPVATLRSMIYAYPTFHRAIEAALADLS